MAIRIDINWDFLSPSTGIASGILTVNDIDADITSSERPKVLLICRCTAKDGSKGFSAVEDGGYAGDVFNEYEDQIRLMMDSFFDGMLLNHKQFYWIPSTLGISNDQSND